MGFDRKGLFFDYLRTREDIFTSGLSFEGKKVPRKLRMSEGSLFGAEVPEAEPQFREICATCGTRMTCSGCSGCGACEKNRAQTDEL